MKLFDTHAHYADRQFDADRAELFDKLRQKGVRRVLCCACNLEEAEAYRKMAAEHDLIRYAVGIHPSDIDGWNDATLAALEEYTKDEKCLAIGEIGLDYHYEPVDKEKQKAVFEAQVALACRLSLPVSVHDRDAHADCFEILDKYRPKGVLHCYSGSAEQAREYIKRGFYIAFGGTATFGNSRKIEKAVRAVPDDRLLIETDCPYLAPVPMRGRRNDSSYLTYTLDALAEIRGADKDFLAEATYENACRLFGRG